jgi:hypothetical protein
MPLGRSRKTRWDKLNGTHQLQAYADVNLLGHNIDSIKKNTEILIDASKEVGLEISVQRTKYMLLSCNQNRDIKTSNTSIENVSQFKYFGTTEETNQNLIQEELKWRLNSGNACYHSVQEPPVFSSAAGKVKIRIYDTVIFLVILYG